MSLASNISLLVATFELKAVDAVLSAIRGADAASARVSGPLGLQPAATYEPRHHIHPEPLIEQRPHVHPEPYFAPRPIIHPHAAYLYDPLCTAPAPVTPSHITKSPIEPVWKTLPPVQPASAAHKIKLMLCRPDTVTKGSLIDCMM